MNRKGGGKARRAVILLFWIAVWQLLSLAVGNHILMAGPVETVISLGQHMVEQDFLYTVLLSFGRISAGFLLAFLLGAVLAAVCLRFRWIEELVQPLMVLLKSVPVASFVVLLLIWWGSGCLSVSVSFLIVFPNVYINTLHGLRSADRGLLQMAEVFRMPVWNRFMYIYRPALTPFMDGCLKVSLGMSWKSGVAAEVIGMPAFSIGEKLYMSKIHLDTAGLFAWTAVIILLSWLFEKLGLYIWKRFCAWEPSSRAGWRKKRTDGRKELTGWRKEREGRPEKGSLSAVGRDITLSHIGKAFGDSRVLKDVSYTIRAGSICVLMGPSGRGKTTVLKILAGLETADTGEADGVGTVTMVFQDDRLCEEYSALRNVEIAGTGAVSDDTVSAADALRELLPEETIHTACRYLSGGQRRRAALARALAAESGLLLLDEPFTGMDEQTKNDAIAFILRHRNGRTVILATHDGQDAVKMGGTVWRLE